MGENTALPTIVETGNNGWGGGNAFAAGVGGLFGSWFGQGFGGWGYGNRGAGQVGADVAIANQLEHVSDQVQQSAISALQSANGTQMQIANTGAGVTAGVTQNTIANLQGFAGVGQNICCATGRLSQEIDQTGDGITAALNQNNITNLQGMTNLTEKLGQINNNITQQGLESQLRMQQLAAMNEQQHCQDRELMRQIATEQMAAKLAEAQAKIIQLETQNYVNQSNSQQTLYLAGLIKPATTTTAAGA